MRTYNYLIIICALLLWGCEEGTGDPHIEFENGIESVDDVLPGDLFYVKGKIKTEAGTAQAFYFHQKTDANGQLEESGDRLELSSDGSFNLGFNVEPATIGVKIIAQDGKGNRSVRIFKVNKGSDNLKIEFGEPSSIEKIETGEEFTVKGTVTSRTKISSLKYEILLGEIIQPAIEIEVTDDFSFNFEQLFTAKSGMTGIRFTAVNRGAVVTQQTFTIGKVNSTGPVIILSPETIHVLPGFKFTAAGIITSDLGITSASYTVVRAEVKDAEIPLSLTDGKFSIELNAGSDITGIIILATDGEGTTSQKLLPVTILYPTAEPGASMIHYKNIVLTAERYPKSYFSFTKAPYVLGGELAKANQADVHLIFLNCFISATSASNGHALIGPNGYGAGTVKAQDYVEGWITLNLSRLVAAPDLVSSTGKQFDEIGDNAADWGVVTPYLKGKLGNSSVIRLKDVKVGYTFAIGYGGTTTEQMNKYAIAIVRGIGGTPAASSGDTGDAWVELEIKTSK